MPKKTVKLIGLFLSLVLLSLPLGTIACAEDAMYEKIVAHNQEQYDNQMTGDDAFYSLVQPDYTDNINSDNTSIIAAAQSITAGCATDYEKIKAVHDWVAGNLYYDLDYYYGTTSGTYVLASDVLKYRYTVCEGYANLVTALLRSLGIPTKGVLGYSIASNESWTEELVSGPTGEVPNHKWNMVWCDGRWMILDVTWDSTNYKLYGVKTSGGGIVEDFFDISVEKLSLEHKIIGLDIGTPFYNRDSGYKYTPCTDGSLAIVGLIDENASSIVIPSVISGKAVSEINAQAFDGCTSLRTAVIPAGIVTIGDYAFYDCTSLEKIYIPATVTALGYLAVGYNTYGITGFIARLSDILTVYGVPGSAAEDYTDETGLPFENAYSTYNFLYGASMTAMTPFSGQLVAGLAATADYDGQLTDFSARDLAAYRLTLTGANVPDGRITLTLRLPAGFDTAYVHLCKISKDGKTPLAFTLDNGFLTFTDTATGADYVITEETDGVLLPGDIDASGDVTVADARLALRAASGLETLTPVRKAIADADGSGSFTILDAPALLRIAVGIDA